MIQGLKLQRKKFISSNKLLASKQPLSKNFILENIWKYSLETDTHTVETHIYRLRQKIKNHFNDDNFIKYTGTESCTQYLPTIPIALLPSSPPFIPIL